MSYNTTILDLCDDSTLLVGEVLSYLPTRCVLTHVHTGVVVICSDQPVCDRCVVFGFVERWKEGVVIMINRNFMRLPMMGVFSHVCSGVLWGMRESVVSDSGRRHWFSFLGRCYRECEEKVMEFELFSLHVAPSSSPNLCIYVLYDVLDYINSLCSGGFADATAGMCWFGVWWGHGTDVSRTGCARLGSATRHNVYTTLL